MPLSGVVIFCWWSVYAERLVGDGGAALIAKIIVNSVVIVNLTLTRIVFTLLAVS